MEYFFSEDVTVSIIQWKYFFSNEIQYYKYPVLIIMDITSNGGMEEFFYKYQNSSHRTVSQLKVSYLKIYFSRQTTHTFIN